MTAPRTSFSLSACAFSWSTSARSTPRYPCELECSNSSGLRSSSWYMLRACAAAPAGAIATHAPSNITNPKLRYGLKKCSISCSPAGGTTEDWVPHLRRVLVVAAKVGYLDPHFAPHSFLTMRSLKGHAPTESPVRCSTPDAIHSGYMDCDPYLRPSATPAARWYRPPPASVY